MRMLIGFCIGVVLIMSLGAVYRVTVQPIVYTDVIDPCDSIYNGLTGQKAWFDKFGNNERTIVLTNLTMHKLMINDLLNRIQKIEDTVFITDSNKANEPNKL